MLLLKLKKVQFLFFLLSVIMLTVPHAAGAKEPPQHIKEKIKVAFSAADRDDYETAYRLYREGLDGNLHYFDEVGKNLLIEQYIMAAEKMVEKALNKGDAGKCLDYARGGLHFGAPDLTNEDYKLSAVYYPMLHLQAALCSAELGRTGQAREYLAKGRQYAKYTTDRDMADYLNNLSAKIEKRLGKDQARYHTGSYITNIGAVQKWIGRVVGKEGHNYSVKITYCNKDRSLFGKEYCSYTVGSTYDFFEDEFKKLSNVSVDAAAKGYK